MKFNSPLLTAAVVGWFQLISASELFHSNSAVLELSGTVFEKKIHKSKHVTFVKFYAPWCGHCRNLAPAYSKVAEKLKGIAKIVSINCDEEMNKPVCGKYDVKGFPTLKLFPSSLVTKGNKKVPLDYNGGRTKKEIIQFIVNSIPDQVQVVVDGDKNTKKIKNHDLFLQLKSTSDTPIPKVLLFTDKSDTSPLYKALGLEFHDRATFGIVRKKQKDTIAKYDVTQFPTLVVVPASTDDTEEVKPIVYDGKMKHDPLSEFLEKHALPKPGKNNKKSTEKATKKEEEKKSTKKSKKAAKKEEEEKSTEKDTKEEEQTESADGDESTGEPTEESFDPNVTELIEQEEFETLCLDESGICVLSLFHPGDNSHYVEKLKEAKKMVHDLKAMNFLPTSTPKINFHYATVTPHTFLLKQFDIPTDNPTHPITLLLQPRQRLSAFRTHDPSDYEQTYQDFLEEAVKDKVKFIKYTFTPKLKKVKQPKPPTTDNDSDKDEL